MSGDLVLIPIVVLLLVFLFTRTRLVLRARPQKAHWLFSIGRRPPADRIHTVRS